ncbi:uncharacterized protein A4U43_C06F13810 [Asparagus officinalis]|uniref:Uncharacterized protein n=1 Tax=Asparagus officinalis TaxID=4686 RepID=A0A5P1ELR3_ASPOF|nr:uncharacterized protein A4U43_C06F13810 [Asparagus officinalis]
MRSRALVANCLPQHRRPDGHRENQLKTHPFVLPPPRRAADLVAITLVAITLAREPSNNPPPPLIGLVAITLVVELLISLLPKSKALQDPPPPPRAQISLLLRASSRTLPPPQIEHPSNTRSRPLKRVRERLCFFYWSPNGAYCSGFKPITHQRKGLMSFTRWHVHVIDL